MPWCYAILRGARVLARCDDQGAFVSDGGRVEIRYSTGAAKAYRAAERNLTRESGEEALPDDACSAVDPDTAKASDRGKNGRGKNKTAAGASATAPEPVPEGSVIAYTDGACSGNPGPAGLGVVLSEDGERRECYRYLGHATNNIAELSAIGVAAEAIENPGSPVRIYTDSRYSIGVLSQGWKAKANRELIRQIKGALERFSDLRLIYVKGHAGIPLNERADELAVSAVEARDSIDWRVSEE